MKTLLRKLVPPSLWERQRRLRVRLESERNRGKTVEQVFTAIYRNNRWGGAKGEFYSGDGSCDERIVAPYVAAIADRAERERFQGLAFVDLGCGDFSVGRQLLPFCSRYVGVDVVKALVARNQAEFGGDRAAFVSLDIVADPLPAGDVCFLRQVLQHLSNGQIAAVLRKLDAYRWVFITEHHPTENERIVFNLDKVHGCDIRFYENSGVYLCEPPFNLPRHALECVLEVPADDGGVGSAGVIRTFLYRPQSAVNAFAAASVRHEGGER